MFKILIEQLIKSLQSLTFDNIEEVETKVNSLFELMKKKRLEEEPNFIKKSKFLFEIDNKNIFKLRKTLNGGFLDELYIQERIIRAIGASNGSIIRRDASMRDVVNLEKEIKNKEGIIYELLEYHDIPDSITSYDFLIAKPSMTNKKEMICTHDIFSNPVIYNGEEITLSITSHDAERLNIKPYDIVSLSIFSDNVGRTVANWRFNRKDINPLKNIEIYKDLISRDVRFSGTHPNYFYKNKISSNEENSLKLEEEIINDKVSSKKEIERNVLPQTLKAKRILVIGGTLRKSNFENIIESRGGIFEMADYDTSETILNKMIKRADIVIVCTTENSHSLTLYAKSKAKIYNSIYLHFNERGTSGFLEVVYKGLNINSTL